MSDKNNPRDYRLENEGSQASPKYLLLLLAVAMAGFLLYYLNTSSNTYEQSLIIFDDSTHHDVSIQVLMPPKEKVEQSLKNPWKAILNSADKLEKATDRELREQIVQAFSSELDFQSSLIHDKSLRTLVTFLPACGLTTDDVTPVLLTGDFELDPEIAAKDPNTTANWFDPALQGVVKLESILDLLSNETIAHQILMLDYGHVLFDPNLQIAENSFADTVQAVVDGHPTWKGWVFLSNNKNQVSGIDFQSGQTLFSRYSLEAIEGAAAADNNQDGRVSLDEFEKYVVSNTEKASWGHTTPVLIGSQGLNDFDLTTVLISQTRANTSNTPNEADASPSSTEEKNIDEEKLEGKWEDIIKAWKAIDYITPILHHEEDQPANGEDFPSKDPYLAIDYAPRLTRELANHLLYRQTELFSGVTQRQNALDFLNTKLDELKKRKVTFERDAAPYIETAIQNRLHYLRAFYIARELALLVGKLETCQDEENRQAIKELRDDTKELIDALKDNQRFSSASDQIDKAKAVELLLKNSLQIINDKLFPLAYDQSSPVLLRHLIESPLLSWANREKLLKHIDNGIRLPCKEEYNVNPSQPSPPNSQFFKDLREYASNATENEKQGILNRLSDPRIETDATSELISPINDFVFAAHAPTGKLQIQDSVSQSKLGETIVDLKFESIFKYDLTIEPATPEWGSMRIENGKLKINFDTYLLKQEDIKIIAKARVSGDTLAEKNVTVNPPNLDEATVELQFTDTILGKSDQAKQYPIGATTYDIYKVRCYPNQRSSFTYKIKHTFPDQQRIEIEFYLLKRPNGANWPKFTFSDLRIDEIKEILNSGSEQVIAKFRTSAIAPGEFRESKIIPVENDSTSPAESSDDGTIIEQSLLLKVYAIDDQDKKIRQEPIAHAILDFDIIRPEEFLSAKLESDQLVLDLTDEHARKLAATQPFRFSVFGDNKELITGSMGSAPKTIPLQKYNVDQKSLRLQFSGFPVYSSDTFAPPPPTVLPAIEFTGEKEAQTILDLTALKGPRGKVVGYRQRGDTQEIHLKQILLIKPETYSQGKFPSIQFNEEVPTVFHDEADLQIRMDLLTEPGKLLFATEVKPHEFKYTLTDSRTCEIKVSAAGRQRDQNIIIHFDDTAPRNLALSLKSNSNDDSIRNWESFVADLVWKDDSPARITLEARPVKKEESKWVKIASSDFIEPSSGKWNVKYESKEIDKQAIEKIDKTAEYEFRFSIEDKAGNAATLDDDSIKKLRIASAIASSSKPKKVDDTEKPPKGEVKINATYAGKTQTLEDCTLDFTSGKGVTRQVGSDWYLTIDGPVNVKLTGNGGVIDGKRRTGSIEKEFKNQEDLNRANGVITILLK